MTTEAWRPVPGFPRYRVSNWGRVESSCHKEPRILAAGLNTNGYRQVFLARDGQRHPRLVNRLVIEAFRGPCPEGLMTRHLNGNCLDNRLENLAYGTARENAADRKLHGTDYFANRSSCSRGHEYTAQNTRVTNGRRWCRPCDRIRQTESRTRRALAAASVPLAS